MTPSTCNICQKTFKDVYRVRAHQLVHTEKKSEECKDCGRCFKWKVSLKSHIMSEHQRKRKKVICPHCNKELTNHALKMHIQNLHKDGNASRFKCKLCARTFKREHHCIEHEKRHGMDNYKCGVCEKEFKWKVTLKVCNL